MSPLILSWRKQGCLTLQSGLLEPHRLSANREEQEDTPYKCVDANRRLLDALRVLASCVWKWSQPWRNHGLPPRAVSCGERRRKVRTLAWISCDSFCSSTNCPVVVTQVGDWNSSAQLTMHAACTREGSNHLWDHVFRGFEASKKEGE